MPPADVYGADDKVREGNEANRTQRKPIRAAIRWVESFVREVFIDHEQGIQ